MNISETGDSYLPSNIPAIVPGTRTSRGGTAATTTPVSQAPRMDAYVPEPADDAGTTNGQDERTSLDTRDAYIPAPRVMRNALYNVSDVKTDINGRVIRSQEPVSLQVSSRGVPDKIADIMLSMGRKLLSIFRITG